MLDAIEFFIAQWRDVFIRVYGGYPPVDLDAVRALINRSFEESNLPYRVYDGVVAPAAPFVGEEVVEPALQALHDRGVQGGVEEFTEALRAHRKGDLRRVLMEARSAVESAMKAALTRLSQPVDAKATSSVLIQALRDCDFFLSAPDQDLFGITGEGVLQAAPSLANKLSAHGQGTQTREVSSAVATLALHVAAAAILYLHSHTTEMV